MKLVLLFACMLPACAGESDYLTELLQKTSARYQHLTNYVIHVKEWRTAREMNMPEFFNPPVTELLLTKAGVMFRYQNENLMTEVVWTTDGKKIWQYRKDLNAYTEEDATPWPDPPLDDATLPSVDWKFVRRFAGIGSMVDRAKLVKPEVAPDNVCPAVTALIEVQAGYGKYPLKEALRVFLGSGLICHLRSEWTRRAGNDRYIDIDELQWEYRQLTGPIDPAQFTFIPPKHAKRVKRLRGGSTPLAEWGQ